VQKRKETVPFVSPVSCDSISVLEVIGVGACSV
jgi:hypothetical protein